MNITYLIGNGFDLNLGLDTTYLSFLKEYIRISEEDDKRIRFFKEQILKNEELWSNAEEAFGRATKNFKIFGYDAKDFCECHEHFCEHLAEYLKHQEQQLNYIVLKETIISGFAPALAKFKDGFREAERESIAKAEDGFGRGYTFNFIDFNYTKTLDECIVATRSKIGAVGKRNYRGVNADNALGKLVHVHGTTDIDMVLGVNDVTQVYASDLFDGCDDAYLSQIIKQKTNELNGENTDAKAFDLLKSSDLIYVYGMSIGATDKLWWERICSLMATKRNLHLILYKYDAPMRGLILRRYVLFEKEEREKFVAYSSLDDETKAGIVSRIHISNTNIFGGLSKLVENPLNEPERDVLTV